MKLTNRARARAILAAHQSFARALSDFSRVSAELDAALGGYRGWRYTDGRVRDRFEAPLGAAWFWLEVTREDYLRLVRRGHYVRQAWRRSWLVQRA